MAMQQIIQIGLSDTTIRIAKRCRHVTGEGQRVFSAKLLVPLPIAPSS